MGNNLDDKEQIRLTFLFRDIYEDYNFFETDIFTNCDIEVNDENKSLLKYIFKVLNREYEFANVLYDTIDFFKKDFYNVLENNFLKIKRKMDLTKKIYKITDDELVLVNTSLNNNAENPNYILEEGEQLKPLKYISRQTYTQFNTGKLNKYLQALEEIPLLQNKEIIDSFRNLFYNIYIKENYYYYGKK